MDRSNTLCAVASAFLALTWITLLARTWVRLRIVKSFGLDDRWMVLTQVIQTVFAVTTIRGTSYGNGKHIADLTPESVKIALKYWYFGELAYTVSTCCAKIAICLFLLRITIHNTHVWILYAVIAISTTCSLLFAILLVAQCHPVSFYWNKDQPGHCVNPHFIINATYAYGAICLTTDLTLGTLPIVVVRRLNMNFRTKLALSGILGMAAIASVATILRFPYIQNFSRTQDYLWETWGISLWSNVEPGIGIVCGNLATLRPLFRELIPSTQGSRPTPVSHMPSEFPGITHNRLTQYNASITKTKANNTDRLEYKSHAWSGESKEELAPKELDIEMAYKIHHRTDITVSEETVNEDTG